MDLILAPAIRYPPVPTLLAAIVALVAGQIVSVRERMRLPGSLARRQTSGERIRTPWTVAPGRRVAGPVFSWAR